MIIAAIMQNSISDQIFHQGEESSTPESKASLPSPALFTRRFTLLQFLHLRCYFIPWQPIYMLHMKLRLNRHFDDLKAFQIAHNCWPCHITDVHGAHGFICMDADGERYSILFNVMQFLCKLLLCKIKSLLSRDSFVGTRTKTCIWWK
jgi:hypothetical protein